MSSDFRHVALSPKQIAAIVLIIGVLICLLGAKILHDEKQPMAGNALLVMAVVAAFGSILLFFLHHQEAAQPDRYPDVLAQLLPVQLIGEMNTLHISASCRQCGNRIRLLVLLQNVYDAPCAGGIYPTPIGTTQRVTGAAVPCPFNLLPGEVVALWRDLPYPHPPTGELSFGLALSVRKPKAPRVRFGRRLAIRSESAATLMTFAALAGGHLHHFSGGRINIPLTPINSTDGTAIPPSDWAVISLWTPAEPRTPDAVADLLRHLLEEPIPEANV